jgi:hypothetical protein
VTLFGPLGGVDVGGLVSALLDVVELVPVLSWRDVGPRPHIRCVT